MKIKKYLTNVIIKILGRQRLIFWLATEASIKEVHSFNNVAKTFEATGQKNLQLQILANLCKSKDKTIKPYLINFLENGNNYISQLGQDCLVDTILKNKTDGFFIEIGVGNGKELSNTYFFEKYRNWDGILCEPAKQFQDSIRKERKALLIDKAVYSVSNKSFEFSESDQGEFSSMTDHLSDFVNTNHTINKYMVETISFNDLCKNYAVEKKIDYLSIDTEGSEYEILSTIDFNKFEITCVSVEHNYDEIKYNKINSLMIKNNFVEVFGGLLMWDTFYINKKILNQSL